jgi:MFS family permease
VAVYEAISLGIVNFVFAALAALLVDWAGRKKLLSVGSVGMVVSLAALGWYFSTSTGFRTATPSSAWAVCWRSWPSSNSASDRVLADDLRAVPAAHPVQGHGHGHHGQLDLQLPLSYFFLTMTTTFGRDGTF